MRLPQGSVLGRVAGSVLAAGALAACTGSGGSVDPTGAPPTSSPSSSRTVPLPSTIVDGHLDPCPASGDAPVLASGGLPDLTLTCLDPGAGAQSVRLAGLRGTPMVLSIWASWCEPCRTELPALAEVAAAAHGSVRFLGVDVEDQSDDAQALAAELGVHFNSVQDPDGLTKQPLGWLGPPITLYVDAGGRVVGRTIGAVGDAAALRGLIAKNLGVSVP